MKVRYIFGFVLGYLLCSSLYAQSYNNMTSLKSSLFNGYDPNIIPLLNQSDIITVNFVISLNAMPEVDTIKSWVKLSMSINISWTDEKLKWEPSQHDDIQQILQTTDSIWMPSFALGSSQEYTYVTTPRTVLIQHTGTISISTKQSFTSMCNFKMDHWPFDRHQCDFHFVQIDSEPGKVHLTTDGTHIQSSDFLQLGQWVYEDCKTTIDRSLNRNKEAIFYNLTFNRQASFYMLTIILPMICISFLSVLVFMLPCDSGERINFSITIMLSMTVFLTIMKDEMPKTSHPLPIMCIYVSALILAVFMNTIANAFCLIIYHRPNTVPINSVFLHLTGLVNCNKGGGRVTVSEESDNYDSAIKNAEKLQNDQMSDQGVRSHHDNQPDIQNKKVNDGIGSEINLVKKLNWKQVTEAMDKIMFVMLLMMLVISTFVSLICVISA